MTNQIISKIKKNWVIILIVFFALALRLWGIGYGLPDFVLGDEKSITYGSLKMLELKTLVPAFYPAEFRLMYYPPLLAYIYLIFLIPVLLIKYLFGNFSGLLDFKNSIILQPTVVWLTVRAVVAFFGAATVYLVYLIGKKLFTKPAGWLAAWFLTLSFLHLQLSHFTRHWVPATFFTTLVIYFSLALYQQPRRKYYILVGIFLGLAFGISYITGLAIVVFLLAHYLADKKSIWEKIKDKNLWLTLAILAILVAIFITLHPQEFFRVLVGEDSTAKLPKTFLGLLVDYGYHLKNLFYSEPVILLFSIISSLILLVKDKKKLALLMIMPILYIPSLYFLLHSEVRYTVFVLPILAILAGFSLSLFFEQLKKFNRYVALGCLILIFLYPLTVALKYDYLLTQKDNRTLAKEWLNNNIAAGQGIITDFYDFKIWPTKAAVNFVQNLDSNSLREEERILLNLSNNQYPVPVFDVLPLHFVSASLTSDNLASYVAQKKYSYFAISYWNQDTIYSLDKYIISRSELIKRFDIGLDFDPHGNYQIPIYNIIFYLNNLGPKVDIYKIKN